MTLINLDLWICLGCTVAVLLTLTFPEGRKAWGKSLRIHAEILLRLMTGRRWSDYQRIRELEISLGFREPDAFQPLPLKDYVAWVYRYLNAGGQIAYVYDHPYPEQVFLLAVRDFTTADECRARIGQRILVPADVRHLGGNLGHCTLYYEDGPRLEGASSVVLYSDPLFASLPGYAKAAAEARARRAAYEAETREFESGHREHSKSSDLSAYVLERDA